MSSDLVTQVQKELDNLQPYVKSHQGYIRLLRVVEKQVFIRLEGTCDTCPLSFYTVTLGLEKRLKSVVDQDIKVIVED